MIRLLVVLLHLVLSLFIFFFFNDTATTEIYTLSLHDALPICKTASFRSGWAAGPCRTSRWSRPGSSASWNWRSEEHTSELQSRLHLVCRLLLEKKKQSTFVKTFVTDE